MNVWILHSIFHVVRIICCSCLVSRSCLTLCYPVDWSTPASSVLYCLLEFAKTHVHWFNDAIQPSHLLLPTSPTAFCLSQHQGLFQWIGSSHHVAKFLELQLQHQSFQWTFKVDLLWDWFIWSLCSPRDSQESSPTPQFNSINSSALSLLYGPTLTYVHDYWENHRFNSTLFWSWPESWFQFSLRCYGISQTNFLANSMN